MNVTTAKLREIKPGEKFTFVCDNARKFSSGKVLISRTSLDYRDEDLKTLRIESSNRDDYSIIVISEEYTPKNRQNGNDSIK